jgi:vancomycin resistance protein YoaR
VRRANEKAGSGLTIVERNSHSLPVTYVPTGLDATVAWPYKDFRFRNSYQHPIYLRSEVIGSRLQISVWGRVPEGGVIPTSITEDRRAETESRDTAG